jgi:mannitol/fructose-specific phosphotransferase system IIA component (Ntr-type)
MKLVDFIGRDDVTLELSSADKDAALREMVGLLDLEDEPEGTLYKLLQKREKLGSTGIGKGVAIPHCRSHVVDRLRVAYGRKREGLAFDAVDAKPVHHLFLIVAPPIEISNQYLPVLGKIAQFCKDAKNLQRLSEVDSVDAFFETLRQADP